jgi:hypothetical protein
MTAENTAMRMDATTKTVPNLIFDTREEEGETHCENDETEVIRRSANAAYVVVSFSTIEITEYPYIPGDNPSVFADVPLTIAWTPLATERCTIDDYEKNRLPRRSRTELRMPSSQRIKMLRRLGFSLDEIQQGSKAAAINRNRRRRTVKTMNLAPAQEVCEKVARAMMNVTVRRMAKKQERRMLGSFRPHMDETSSCFRVTSSETSLAATILVGQ